MTKRAALDDVGGTLVSLVPEPAFIQALIPDLRLEPSQVPFCMDYPGCAEVVPDPSLIAPLVEGSRQPFLGDSDNRNWTPRDFWKWTFCWEVGGANFAFSHSSSGNLATNFPTHSGGSP